MSNFVQVLPSPDSRVGCDGGGGGEGETGGSFGQVNDSRPGGERKRRFVISQQPLGTGEQYSAVTLVSLQSEVRSVQNSLNTFCGRMTSMETKMSLLLDKCSEIVEKIACLEQHIAPCSSSKDVTRSVLFNTKLVSRIRDRESVPSEENSSMMEEVGVAQMSPDEDQIPQQHQQKMFTDTSQIIKLNSESDFPDGSWLGNPENCEERVRVSLGRAELDNVNLSCCSPEKMALALLEHLFSRETLATSNLTGKGKHKKKQLDPLIIFGIFCHLRYRFDIDESTWVRIKNNMEAKCRFLWTRRSRGLPLGVGGGLKAPSKAEAGADQLPEFSSCPIYWGGGGGSEPRVITEYQLYDDKLLAGTVLVSAGANLMLGGGEQTQELTVDSETDNSIS